MVEDKIIGGEFEINIQQQYLNRKDTSIFHTSNTPQHILLKNGSFFNKCYGKKSVWTSALTACCKPLINCLGQRVFWTW